MRCTARNTSCGFGTTRFTSSFARTMPGIGVSAQLPPPAVAVEVVEVEVAAPVDRPHEVLRVLADAGERRQQRGGVHRHPDRLRSRFRRERGARVGQGARRGAHPLHVPPASQARAERDAVDAFGLFRAARPGEGARPREAACRPVAALGGILRQPPHRVREARVVRRIDGDAHVPHHFGQRRSVRGDHRNAGGHRFQRGQAEAFVDRRIDQHRGARVELRAAPRRAGSRAVAPAPRSRARRSPPRCPR